MAVYQIPESAEQREKDLMGFMEEFSTNLEELREKKKKAAGGRAKKALNNIKKLATAVRRDIQEEINSVKK